MRWQKSQAKTELVPQELGFLSLGFRSVGFSLSLLAQSTTLESSLCQLEMEAGRVGSLPFKIKLRTGFTPVRTGRGPSKIRSQEGTL